ncbi:MAG: hypothetical protein M1830_000224 [Pleopsidium flavum]|nr:MAG: hypothetical protein M1830_000224 [Pleopsidium flavum]
MELVPEKYRSFSAGEMQKAGQLLYRSKNYREALTAFTAAVTRSDTAIVGALDNRAATYTKLGDLQAALRDAKRMISLERSGATGYLRTGKILQLMGKEDVALGIYRYGLRNVPSDNPNHKLLQAMFDKLAHKPSLFKAVDPFLMLPVEILEMVINYLDFKNLVILLRVSKQWNHFLTSMPRFWNHLDLSSARKPVKLTTILACVRRSKGSITHATFNRVATTKSNILKHVTSRAKGLRHIEIMSGFAGSSMIEAAPLARNLTTLIVWSDCGVTLDTITRLLSLCDKLERAEFHSIYSSGAAAQWQISSKLRTLTLKAAQGVGSANITSNTDSLIEQIPNVSELCLHGWVGDRAFDHLDLSKLENLRSLKLCRLQSRVFPKLPTGIRNLDLSYNYNLDFHRLESRHNLENYNLNHLEFLDLCFVPNLSGSSLETLLRPSKGKLQGFNINNCSQVDRVAVNQLMTNGYLDRIVDLSLFGLEIDDSILETLALLSPHLKRLHLSSTKITGVGVKALVLKPQELIEELVLTNCVGISIDAVEFAKAKGINVTFTFPDDLKYGKRVRLS